MAPSRAQDTLGAGSWRSPQVLKADYNMASSRILRIDSKTDALDAFHKLVADLSKLLGPSSGIDSDDVDVQELRLLMENYTSNAEQWSRYAFADHSRGYTRNLVDEGNGKSNLLVLVWTPGNGSPIHDHADAHCIMKVLQGRLKETRFQMPEAEHIAPKNVKETVFERDEVTYMSDELGLHKISNPDPKKVAVSLHLYTPQNAAREGCNIFNERTGKKCHVTQSNFYSVFGEKVAGTI